MEEWIPKVKLVRLGVVGARGLGLLVLGLGLPGFGGASGSEIRVQGSRGLGFRVQGLGSRFEGSWIPSWLWDSNPPKP